MKKTFQNVLTDIEENLIGMELNSISGNAATFVVSDVDYVNSAVVLSVQGKRKTWTFDRLQKVWNEMYYRPAANVEIVFGGSGSSRNQVETIFASMAYVEWLYVNSKKCIAYVGQETHKYGSLMHMASDKEQYYQKLMSEPNPRNPLLEIDKSPIDIPADAINEYQEAAQTLKDFVLETGYEIPTSSDDIERALNEFKQAYSPEKLASIDDSAILTSLFYSLGDNTNALCCWLEMNKECRSYFGSIAGGSAYKFGLFQKKETGIWTTGSPQKPQELTETEALTLGKQIRDALVAGVKIIRESQLDSLETYERLDNDLIIAVGNRFYNLGWVHKYFSIICNDKLCGFHSSDWQYHVLRSLKIKPSDRYYGRSGQISMIQNYTSWFYRQFFDVFDERFGEPRQFIRLGSTDGDKKNYAYEWSKKSVVGMGWAGIGDLSEFVMGDGINKRELQDKLRELYFFNDNRTASRKAGELTRFYSCGENTVFVVMNGERIIAFADKIGSYFYDGNAVMAHQRPAEWHFVFASDSVLPEKSEGLMTSCQQIKNDKNLLFLYEKYYYSEEHEAPIDEDKIDSQVEEEESMHRIRFTTGLQLPFERNRIVFGAPGTGKSYTLNMEKCSLLGIDDADQYERVTFHPDYSYANFVGTYKPIPIKDVHGNDMITYGYVPGPFMRVYANALKNSRTDDIKPFLLIIEEINRANVAAVFGDVFQLLDRGEDNASEYPIQASQDIQNYLAKELGGNSEDYRKIRIPDNMFIWATMNSADQGVFPMDTAFKRRWDFTYLGIDDNDDEIEGKYVLLKKDKSQKVEWNKLRKAINHFLAMERINEDKQLGPYFLSRKLVVPNKGNEIDHDAFIRVFTNKVIMYLFEDAAKQKRSKLFEGCADSCTRYSEICKAFLSKGIEIFHHDIQSKAEPTIVAEIPKELEI